MKVKKIRLGNWSETLTDNELKNVVGGYAVWSGACFFSGNGDEPVYYEIIITGTNSCQDVIDACEEHGGDPGGCCGISK